MNSRKWQMAGIGALFVLMLVGVITASAILPDARHQDGEEWLPAGLVFETVVADFGSWQREQALGQMVDLMVANYVRIGTPIDAYWHGGDAEERAFYEEALERAQAVIDDLPDRVILPTVVYMELAGQNRVPLGRAQMGNLREAYGFFTRGFGVLPNYLQGLSPSVAAGIMGNIGGADSFRNDTGRENGFFGIFQLGPELYAAYEAWCRQGDAEMETHLSVWHQCAFFWEVLNGWGYNSYVTVDYTATLAKLLAAETVAEATIILNEGFFRAGNGERRVEWAEQIYGQLLAVRP
jgi:hypothetical protein